MKRQEFVGIGLVIALVSWAGNGIQAQGAAQDAKGKTTTVTGCLAKGADATTFTLSDAMPATADKEIEGGSEERGEEELSPWWPRTPR